MRKKKGLSIRKIAMALAVCLMLTAVVTPVVTFAEDGAVYEDDMQMPEEDSLQQADRMDPVGNDGSEDAEGGQDTADIGADDAHEPILLMQSEDGISVVSAEDYEIAEDGSYIVWLRGGQSATFTVSMTNPTVVTNGEAAVYALTPNGSDSSSYTLQINGQYRGASRIQIGNAIFNTRVYVPLYHRMVDITDAENPAEITGEAVITKYWEDIGGTRRPIGNCIQTASTVKFMS